MTRNPFRHWRPIPALRRPCRTAWAALALCLLAASCDDQGLPTDALPAGNAAAEGQMYWHTRTRTAVQQQVMLRNHGVGFSFDAINSEKCDVGGVRCQVLDLDALEVEGAYYGNETGKSDSHNTCSRSFAEYCHNVNITANVSGGVLIYKKSYTNTAAIFEHAFENSICFTSERRERALEKVIDTDVWARLLRENPERFLSDNFLYAINKVKRAGVNNVTVVDSLIDIFGTHVITEAAVGGMIKLDVVANDKTVQTFAEESTLTESSLDLFFKKKKESMTEAEFKAATTVLENAELHLEVMGGDLTHLSSLVADPTYDNALATPEALDGWLGSIDFDADDPWNSKCEMLDMEVSPIWDFIPDPTVSALVKSRIIATAPTMQELYGNRNFVNVAVPLHVGSVTTAFGGQNRTFVDPWVVDVIAANRHVATVCREWVPEIDPHATVSVVYPIYENHLQMDAGLCVHNGKPWRVRWLYDGFRVEAQDTLVSTDEVFLTFGYLEYGQTEGADYQPATLRVGYEWPGSIDINGNLTNKDEVRTTRKFLNHFYLDNDTRYTNLPNWSYSSQTTVPGYYTDNWGTMLNTDEPYALSGIRIFGRSGKDHTAQRMVRNDDYTYYLNATEVTR